MGGPPKGKNRKVSAKMVKYYLELLIYINILFAFSSDEFVRTSGHVWRDIVMGNVKILRPAFLLSFIGSPKLQLQKYSSFRYCAGVILPQANVPFITLLEWAPKNEIACFSRGSQIYSNLENVL